MWIKGNYVDENERSSHAKVTSEWLFVGHNVEVFDSDNLVSHGDASMNSTSLSMQWKKTLV
jgi:hypothetical protein